MSCPEVPGLVFDEKTHSYTYDGRRLPGVTSVLNELVRVEYGDREFYVNTLNGQTIAAEVIRSAGDYGRAVHKVMDLALNHGIDAIFYPEEIEPSVKALVQWQADYRPELIAVEQRVHSLKYWYAGTFDILCYLPLTKRLALIDVKTGEGALTGPQTAAYLEAWRECTGERKAIDRYKLRLPKVAGETYRLIPCANPQDWVYFTHRLFAREFHANL